MRLKKLKLGRISISYVIDQKDQAIWDNGPFLGITQAHCLSLGLSSLTRLLLINNILCEDEQQEKCESLKNGWITDTLSSCLTPSWETSHVNVDRAHWWKMVPCFYRWWIMIKTHQLHQGWVSNFIERSECTQSLNNEFCRCQMLYYQLHILYDINILFDVLLIFCRNQKLYQNIKHFKYHTLSTLF